MIDLDVALEALAHLICSDAETPPRDTSKAHRRHHALTPRHFDGFEPLTNSDDFVLLGDNAADLPVWPLDICTACLAGDDWETGSWQFQRVRTLDPRQWRGKLRYVMPRMLERSILTSRPNGEHVTVTVPLAIVGRRAQYAAAQITGMRIDNAWVGIPDPAWYGGDGPEEDETRLVQCIAGLSLRRHYLWSVLLGEGTGPRARFVTDPTGVREAFRLRDIPPGKQRRAALLHWVRAHWRVKRTLSPDDRAWVTAHLRGVWSYTWNGLRCQIEPSIEDMAVLSGGSVR